MSSMDVGYKESFEAAGATVLEYKEFGDYQGTWLAYVVWDGNSGFVVGGYGSCSGCDAFLEEFSDVWWDEDIDPERLAAFGRHYLDQIVSCDELLNEYRRMDADYMLDEDKMILNYLESFEAPSIQ